MARLNFDVSDGLAGWFELVAEEDGTTKADIMRRAIGLYRAARDAEKRGKAIGFVPKEETARLETVILGVTSS